MMVNALLVGAMDVKRPSPHDAFGTESFVQHALPENRRVVSANAKVLRGNSVSSTFELQFSSQTDCIP